MDDGDGTGDLIAMNAQSAMTIVEHAVSWSSGIALAALACVAGGVSLWMRARVASDALVQTLLDESAYEERPSRGSRQSLSGVDWMRIKAWIIGAAALSGCAAMGHNRGPAQILLYLLLGCGAGELLYRGRGERARKERERALEFYLPTAMERVVMAVGAGLDIIPALSEAARGSADPVSDIFRRIVSLSEGGLRVEHAIQISADSVPCLSVKHALAHLILAYKQGGEIVRPLRELSDATQTQYQESVEEEIAKLPVRAVLPLILTFTGLIICFLTVPVVQVGASLEKFTHATK